jgi:AcrR family transcriptional regulator
MDRAVQDRNHKWTVESRTTANVGRVPATVNLTPKGAATRSRIVATAADLVLARGIGGTSLDDIRAGTSTSKGQLFHYFPGGKAELVGAIASFQGERVLDAQRPSLDSLDSWEAWESWRRAVLDHYGSQTHWGCPISALAREVLGNDPERAAELTAYMDRWRGYLQAGVARMRSTGILRPEADPQKLALSIFAALQGGLLLTQTMQALEPLDAALEGALTILRAAGAAGSAERLRIARRDSRP